MPKLISELPDDIRKIALQRQKEVPYVKNSDDLNNAFTWHKTKENHTLWFNVCNDLPSKEEAYKAFRAFQNALSVDGLQAEDKPTVKYELDKKPKNGDELIPFTHPHGGELLDIVTQVVNSTDHQMCKHGHKLCVAYKQNGVQVRIGLEKGGIWAGMKQGEWWVNVTVHPSILKDIINWVELYL